MNKRESIIKAALDEFSQNDYEQASINKIIKEAKTSKGNFYHYFKNKEELYMALVSEAYQKKLENVIYVETDDFFEQLQHQIMNGIQFAKDYPAYYHLSRRFAKEKGSNIYNRVIKEIVDCHKVDETDTSLVKSYQKQLIDNDYPLAFVEKVMYYTFENINDAMEQENMELSNIQKVLELTMKLLKNGLQAKKPLHE
ncbi:TetR/AcrR family transcriptional regulator [Candidatus Galacturonibacter soehngenii]|uniref:TetR/AcrR family transcriptional regulator n=1 Tax=Candidatus Galacturonatibacter soehngenii TaxID=2307010 RepID=A0A7V7UC16_9FIRM|nr:TetR/AcrR family transcriptional regulator [Candidatus Galacturonibacter soehngenii]KAB1438485.1 TetR/AcrR family transcriptional regulator [Candidatus Galacturonibacter soehngenii]